MNIITSLDAVEPLGEIFQSYLPDHILVKVDRADMGVCLGTLVPRLHHRAFEFAWSSSLAFKMREWAGTLLAEPILRGECFFDHAPLRRKRVKHLSGQRNWQRHLWDLLMLQAWREASHG